MIDLGNMLLLGSEWTVVPNDDVYRVRWASDRRASRGWGFLPLCWVEALA